jgi:methylthioribulose-1-phosphate dehydratase
MSAVSLVDPAAVEELRAFGAFAAARGWVPATAGNFSRRLDAQRVVVTRSGVDKGAIDAGDLVVLRLDEPIPPGVSAETPLHLARYRADASIGAVLHVHTVAATVLSRREAAAGVLRLRGFEMQKALGRSTHDEDLMVPIVANAQDTVALAESVERRLRESAGDGVPGYVLAGHGLYAWGATVRDARRHLEGFEFLLACALEERRIAP